METTEEVSITEAEAVEAWRGALGIVEVVENPVARTVSELCEEHGIGYYAMRNRLQKAMAAGTVKKVRVRRINSRKQCITTDAYILLA